MRVRGSRGFTVLESVIAILIGTMVIVSMMYVLAHGFRLADDNRSHLYAINALRSEVEFLRPQHPDNITALGASSTFTNAQIVKLHNGSGTRAIVNDLGSEHKKVTLTVSYNERSGRTVSEDVTTHFARRGLNGL